MANSYQLYTANGSTTDFSLVGIDGWISSGFLKVYVNDVLQTTGYTLQDLTTASPFVRFTSAPANLAIVRLQRETPNTVSGFQGNVVNFNDASVLTEQDLDNMAKGLLHIAQEAEDTGSGALPLNLQQTHWDAGSKRLTALSDGLNAQDAVTMAQLTSATLYGGAATTPQVWAHTGTGSDTYALSPAPLSTTREMFLVERGGVIQNPNTYTITTSSIVFDSAVPNGMSISIRNLGVARNINESVTSAMLVNDSVTAAKIATGAVGSDELATNSVITAKIANDAVTYAKMQNVSATDKVLGRSTAGAGDVEEITCTAAGRALLDDANVEAQRNTLELGALAIKNTIVNADVAAGAGIELAKLQTINADRVLGAVTTGAPTAITCTSIGRGVLAAATVGEGQAAINAIGYPVLAGSAVGRWVPLSHTVGASAGATLLSTVNGNITAGTWAVVWIVFGGAGAYETSHLATMAHNAQISTIPGYSSALNQKIGGFAIRIA